MSKERPILFSAPMVRALLDGSKSQTRRVVKPQPEVSPGGHVMGEWLRKPLGGLLLPRPQDLALDCPYGQPGDRLRVRETFTAYGRWETRFSAKKARDEWHFVDMTVECDRRYQYAADNPGVPLAKERGDALPGWYTRPAIFMPRAASRILLEIVNVRVERLNAITLSDICKEGLAKSIYDFCPATDGFRVWKELWESINGAGSWAANPWVWVLEFKRVQP